MASETGARSVDLVVAVNPSLRLLGTATHAMYETCMSMFGWSAGVARHAEVELTAWDARGEKFVRHATGLEARIYQHECDHLRAVTFIDRMIPGTLTASEYLE